MQIVPEKITSTPIVNMCYHLFIFWLYWVFLAVCRLPVVVENASYSLLCFPGFSLW